VSLEEKSLERTVVRRQASLSFSFDQLGRAGPTWADFIFVLYEAHSPPWALSPSRSSLPPPHGPRRRFRWRTVPHSVTRTGALLLKAGRVASANRLLSPPPLSLPPLSCCGSFIKIVRRIFRP